MSENTMNGTGNQGGSVTVALPIKSIRRNLIALRVIHGAKSKIGHRCSNIIELIQNTEGTAGDVRKMVNANIEKQMADLAQLASQ